MASPAIFTHITIVGLGLIGGSIARAVKKNRLADRITGSDVDAAALAYAHAHGFIDTGSQDASADIGFSQLIVLATPLSALQSLAGRIAPHLAPGTIIMDTASVKQAAMDAITSALPAHTYFIPAHPIAGNEQSGVTASRDDLFQDKRVIITPDKELPPAVLQAVSVFWEGMGARMEVMQAARHDLIYAYVSHLPQLLAFAARGLAAPHDPLRQRFLRLGGSSAALWTEIFMLNRKHMLTALDDYLAAMEHFNDRPWPFPRIAASCLVEAVNNAEKRLGFPLAHYAGIGFADFTAVADSGDTGNNSVEIVQYMERLKLYRSLIADGTIAQLQKALA